ncbi:MAG: hypothetical protein ACKOSS_00995 [Planctomycetia bacterium]
MITVVPGGGLCNRMAMLDSALALGRRLQRPVHVLWKLGHQLNCRLERLFEPLPGLASIACVHNDTLAGRISTRVRQGWADLRGTDTWYRAGLYTLRNDPQALLERARQAARLRIRGDTRFYADGAPFQGFRPAPALAARIAQASRGLEQALGVHIRRTDHAEALRRSPLEAFQQALRQERRRDPGTRFYVATDDSAVLQALVQEHGAAIVHSTPRSLDRNCPEAIEDALLDLWCLSRCRAVLGSVGSTFSETAWQLRDIPHRVVDVLPAHGGSSGHAG